MAGLGGFLGRLFGIGSAIAAPPTAPKWLSSLAEVEVVIAGTGFSESAAEIKAHCAPCLHILDAGPANGLPPGATRFGGSPDLPIGASWPQSDKFSRPGFFGQINLADIQHSPVAGQLPQTGLLSFFADLETFDQNPVGVHVAFTPSGTDLAAVPAPAGIETYNPVSVRFEPGVAFTHFDWNWLEELAQANPDGNIDALSERLSAAPWPVLGRLLGYADWLQDDLREEVYFAEIGRTGQQRLRQWRSWEDWERAKGINHRLANGTAYSPWSAKDDPNVRWIIDHSEEVAHGVEQWQSLLTIESGKAMNLWINDANAIYFFARAVALERGDFSDVRAVTTQS